MTFIDHVRVWSCIGYDAISDSDLYSREITADCVFQLHTERQTDRDTKRHTQRQRHTDRETERDGQVIQIYARNFQTGHEC